MAETERAPALSEGLHLLEQVIEADSAVPFEELVDKSNMSRSSINRLLKVLVASGFLHTGDDKRSGYVPGLRLIELARAGSLHTDPLRTFRTVLRDRATELGVSFQVVMFDRDRQGLQILEKAEPPEGLRLQGPGQDLTRCAHRHAAGKVVLAFGTPKEKKALLQNGKPAKNEKNTLMPGPELDAALEEVRKQGRAVDREESSPGMFRVGVPLFSRNGELYGSLAASWFAKTLEQKKVSAVSKALEDLAKMFTTVEE